MMAPFRYVLDIAVVGNNVYVGWVGSESEEDTELIIF